MFDEYGPAGPPKNGSDDALHADHLWPLAEETLHSTTTVEGWVAELDRLSAVAVVTARENYRLMSAEKRGIWSPDKYAEPGVALITVAA